VDTGPFSQDAIALFANFLSSLIYSTRGRILCVSRPGSKANRLQLSPQHLTGLAALRKPNNQEPPHTRRETPIYGGGSFGPHPGKALVKLTASVLAKTVVLSTILLDFARGAAAEGLLAGREDPSKATGSRSAREEAARSIPLAKLSAQRKAKASWVLSNGSIYRRLPIRVVPCDPDMYLFLVQHPDVVVNIWEVMGASHLTMEQTGPDSFRVTDDIGTVGTLEFLYRSRDVHLVYVDGTYRGPLFGQPIRARGLMLLTSDYLRDTDGRCYITSRLDSFMHIEPSGVEFLTKTFLPVVGKVADNNFVQTAAFLASVSRTAEVNNPGVQRLASRLSKVQPEIRKEFAQVAEQVSQKALGPGKRVAVGARQADGEAPGSGAIRVAQRPDPASPLPAADLATTPLVQSQSETVKTPPPGPSAPSPATPATPAQTASKPTP
jgi:hypothetical protein